MNIKRHLVLKLLKHKHKMIILLHFITYKGSSISLCLLRNFGGQKTVGWYIQREEERKRNNPNCQPRIQHPGKFSSSVTGGAGVVLCGQWRSGWCYCFLAWWPNIERALGIKSQACHDTKHLPVMGVTALMVRLSLPSKLECGINKLVRIFSYYISDIMNACSILERIVEISQGMYS